MVLKVAINGFGRIGRMILRAGIDDKKIRFVAINDLASSEQLAYLLKYDSIQPKVKYDVSANSNSILIGKQEIPIFQEKSPEKLPWRKLDIDVVIESTGIFRDLISNNMHLNAGAKKAIISAPGKGEPKIPTYILGVNAEKYKGEKIISNASCTTNCVAPVAKVLNDTFKIKKAFLTTVHAYTNDQTIVDSPHKDFRRGRAAALNMIPTSTGAAKALYDVIPELEGKCDGIAVRVPIACGSLIDFVAELESGVNVEEVNAVFKKYSETKMKNILEYSDSPLVSSDCISSPYSAIFDAQSTMTIKNLVKVLAWYDNEYGYSCRMIDMIKHISK